MAYSELHQDGDRRKDEAESIAESLGPEVARCAFRAGSGRACGGLFADGGLGRAFELAVSARFSGEKPEAAYATVALGHEVSSEAPQEGLAGQGDLLLGAAVAVVLGFKGDGALLLIDALDARVADGDTAGVAGEVANDCPGVAQRGTAEDVPVAPSEAHAPVAACFERVEGRRPVQIATSLQGFDAAQEDRPENLRHGAHWKKIVGPRLAPFAGAAITPARGNEHVQMRMPVERAAPSVEH